jgi:hypothetical protein
MSVTMTSSGSREVIWPPGVFIEFTFGSVPIGVALAEKKEAQAGLLSFGDAIRYQVNVAPRRMWREICQRFGCPYSELLTTGSGSPGLVPPLNNMQALQVPAA